MHFEWGELASGVLGHNVYYDGGASRHVRRKIRVGAESRNASRPSLHRRTELPYLLKEESHAALKNLLV